LHALGLSVPAGRSWFAGDRIRPPSTDLSVFQVERNRPARRFPSPCRRIDQCESGRHFVTFPASEANHDIAKLAPAAVPLGEHGDRQIDRPKAAPHGKPRVFYQAEWHFQDELGQSRMCSRNCDSTQF